MTRISNNFLQLPSEIKVAILVFVLMLFHSSFNAFAEIIDDQDCNAVFSKYCGKFSDKKDVEGLQSCLAQNMNQWKGSCLEQAQELMSPTGKALMACAADYKKLCGIDINRSKNNDEEGEKVINCVLSHWNQLSSECQEINKGVLELTGANIQKLVQSRRSIRVGSTTVKSWAQQGDTIWYEVQMVRKKVLDKIDFCPESKGKGLRRRDAVNMGTCYYEIIDPWWKALIRDLKNNNVLSLIDGFGLRGIEKDESLKLQQNLPLIRSIVAKYKDRCPEGFDIDVSNYNNSASQGVICTKFNFDNCPDGYYRSSYDNGYFGCIKTDSCQENNPQYVELGSDESKIMCGYCQAGGYLDFAKSREMGVALCQVNAKNPKKTPVLPKYVLRKYYDDKGRLLAESYDGLSYPFFTKEYSEDGKLKTVRYYRYRNEVIKTEHYDQNK